MSLLTEGAYCTVEALIITWFVTSYFGANQRFSKKVVCLLTFSLIYVWEIIISIISLHWIPTFWLTSLILFGIFMLLLRGSTIEKLIISSTTVLLLAISDVCAFTLIGYLLKIDYHELITNSNFSRTLSVLTSKLLYIIVASAILFFKNKYRLFLHKREAILMIATIFISIVQLSLIRTIIYSERKYYNIFLIIILCIIVLNIIVYYAMLYIGKKNTDEKNYSLMQKQLELQSDNIRILEQKYDETAKIRHDMKNHISVALNMAEKNEYSELVQYLESLLDEKIDSITSYINTNRSVLGAVLNSKLSKAKQNNIEMQCFILSEFDNISDIDIGILFANLLDNSIEVCEKNNIESEIIVKTWVEAGYYFLQISNTVENDVLGTNPNLETNKDSAELHGVGLRSVRDIVKKYDGIINFEQKGNVFYIYVSLENSQ